MQWFRSFVSPVSSFCSDFFRRYCCSFDATNSRCPRVYCVSDADPLVAGAYWEDLSNFVQDQVPRYIKGAIATNDYLDCRGVPPPAAIETAPPTPKQSLEDTCDGKTKVLTKLDFYDATLTENTLHYPDQSGRLRYAGVGVFHGEAIDLVVTQHPGSAPYSTDMSIRNGYNRGTLVFVFSLFRCCFYAFVRTWP